MRRNWPILILAIFLLTILCVSSYTGPSHKEKQAGTNDNTPIASVGHNETGQSSDSTQPTEKLPFWRRLFAWPDGVATLGILLTLFFIAWQAMLMRQTVVAAEDMSQRELRAYLNVLVGEALFQQRRPAEEGGDLMFEARPIIVNTGRTPARQIIYKARAAILPVPLPKETHLPEEPDAGLEGSILGSQQNANMAAVVDGFRPNAAVDAIKSGVGHEGLYVWGKATYQDVFEQGHFVRFCQQIYWDRKGNVRGLYTPGRNDAD